MDLAEKISNELYQRSKLNLNRFVSTRPAQAIDFASNDYLGLADRPLTNGAAGGIAASVMVNGYSPEQQALEEALADYLSKPAAMLFATGYQGNVGIMQGLLDKDDHVLIDKLSHASIIDGLQLANANWRRYRHLDHDHLAKLVKPATRLTVTEGLFSMDGDWLDVEQFCNASGAAWKMVDDAHGFMVRPIDINNVDIYMATFSKALGGIGGFIAASKECIDYMRQFARSHIFSTGLPPALIKQMHQNFDLAKTGERQEKLQENIALWQSLTGSELTGPIQIFLQPDIETLLAKNTAILQAGYMVGAIRRPAVKEPRLRITLSSKHNANQIKHLAELVMTEC